MERYQLRVIEEKEVLDEKVRKLSNFISSSKLFNRVTLVEQNLMIEQCEVMWKYSDILEKRITSFR